MRDFSEDERRTKISTLLAPLRGRPLPIVREYASIEDVIGAMIRFEHSRVLYVVNDQGQLTGMISLGTLVRQVFSAGHVPQTRARFLIGLLTAETAKDIMFSKPVAAMEDEEVGTVVGRMIDAEIKEIPVLDRDRRVVGDLTMIDLLKFLSTST